MSNLAQLLNPAPSLDSAASAQVPNGQSHTQHSRNLSLTSPLEALAIVATTSPPMQSPTHPVTVPITSPNSHQRSFSNSSSRPGSSHFSLPMPHALSHPSALFSPPFDQHAPNNHQISGTKISDIPNSTSRQLPPLRSSFSDDVDAIMNTLPIERPSVDAQDQLTYTSEQHLPGFHEIHNSHPGHISQSIPPTSIDSMTNSSSSRIHADLNANLPIQKELRPNDVDKGESLVSNNSWDRTWDASRLDGTNNAISEERDFSQAPADVTMKRNDSTREYSVEQGLATSEGGDRVSSQPPVSKKRPAPKTERKIEKKGIASAIKKPAAKKRKLDIDVADGTPSSRRSGTPASSRASKTPAPRNHKQNSTTPMHSSPAPTSKEIDGNEDEDMDDDSELFCICRKPDDHTWMIACDGGCEDWFHGRCVDMNERDGNLIDKYICPNCRERGIGQTTWKPMCRLGTCREPARVTGAKPSKYCCDQHGELFMASLALGKDARKVDGAKGTRGFNAARNRRKDNMTDNTANADDEQSEAVNDDDQAYLRGGVLRTNELKALTSGVKDLEEFNKLGEGVLSPPRTASPDETDVKMEGDDAMSKEKSRIIHTAEEKSQLEEIASKKASVKRKREMLDVREKFLVLVKDRARMMLEELKKKEGFKDVCGFDSRLTWSDEEFDDWRASSDGQKALESGVPGPPSAAVDGDGDLKMVNGEGAHAGDAWKGACQKKRCGHKQWFKIQQQSLNMEKDVCRQEMRQLEVEEKGVRERAMVRHLEGEGDEKLGEADA
ncbi:hypothetical protein MMC13_003614 [Lambiella insularis]|nr:hypothetical protein [Lambiella insularis]